MSKAEEKSEDWVRQAGRTKVIALIHGLDAGDPQDYWEAFLNVLSADEALREFDLFVWKYPTHKKLGWLSDTFSSVKRRTPRKTAPGINSLGRAWAATYTAQFSGYQEIVLICHSMGGLVIKSWITDALVAGHSATLDPLRHVTFYSTPHNGAPVTWVARWNGQLKDMQITSDLIRKTKDLWNDRVVDWKKRKPGREDHRYNRYIPHLVIGGLTDGLVKEGFSTIVGMSDYTHTIRGDHSEVIQPQYADDDCYRIWRIEVGKILGVKQQKDSLRSRKPERITKLPFDSLERPEAFVGRREDLKWLLERLRLGEVTSITALGGMGGIGKTRLAAEAIYALRQGGSFKDGIVVMRCGGRTEANRLVQSTLARFDPQGRLPETNHPSELIDVAHRLLDGKKALIVLDNVEPELDIRNVVVPLSATSITLLLTARQVLPYTIVPEEGNRCLDLLSPEEAMELLSQSFGLQVSWTRNTPEYAAANRIITALGRHTLAVKLAGAYAAVVKRDLGELAKDLEDPQQAIDLRDGETPEGLARIFVQSTESLPNDSRQLFEALATFATTSFGRQATLALGTALGLARPAVAIDELVLRRLVDASINDDMPEQSDRERRSLHPLTHAFAARKFGLWSQDRQDTAHHALASFYATYAGRVTKVSDRALGIDEDNINRKLEWAQNCRQSDLVVQLCMGMQYFWRNGGRRTTSSMYLPLGIAAAKEIAKVTHKREDRLVQAVLAYTHGQVLFQTGRPDEASDFYLPSTIPHKNLGTYGILIG